MPRYYLKQEEVFYNLHLRDQTFLRKLAEYVLFKLFSNNVCVQLKFEI